MATLDEIAHGLVSVLRFGPQPEPMGVDLWGQTAEEASYLATAVIDECTAAGVPLRRVRISTDLVSSELGSAHEGVVIEPDASLFRRIEFERG